MTLEREPINRRRILAFTLIITAALLLGSAGLSRLAHALEKRAAVEATAVAASARNAELLSAEATIVADFPYRGADSNELTTVVQLFENTDPIVIRDWESAQPYPSEIEVSGINEGRILDLALILNGFSHTHPDDVDLVLIAPNGKIARVMSDAGGSVDVDGLTIVFTEDMGPAVPDDDDLGDDGDVIRYTPANYDGDDGDEVIGVAPAADSNTSLFAFADDDPNGIWQLLVSDDSSNDVGTISGGWAIRFNTRVRTE